MQMTDNGNVHRLCFEVWNLTFRTLFPATCGITAIWRTLVLANLYSRSILKSNFEQMDTLSISLSLRLQKKRKFPPIFFISCNKVKRRQRVNYSHKMLTYTRHRQKIKFKRYKIKLLQLFRSGLFNFVACCCCSRLCCCCCYNVFDNLHENKTIYQASVLFQSCAKQKISI